tara:strand:+ start:455 stop:727 length:273 start_codon:yes stop_codon:yes gene_type:complete
LERREKMNALKEMVLLGKLDRQVKKSEEVKEPNTDHIYSTALAYACFKSGPKRVDDNLLKNMFKDLCLLSDEYAFDYKQELKNILEKGVK